MKDSTNNESKGNKMEKPIKMMKNSAAQWSDFLGMDMKECTICKEIMCVTVINEHKCNKGK